MTNRWKLSLAQLFSLLCGLFLALVTVDVQAAKLDAYFVVKWEGRALEEPNLEALDKLRKKFPEVPFIHLINPSYFKESSKVSGNNYEAIKQRIADFDEVGLYLVPSANLVKAADVMLLKKPTFFSYNEELCNSDCGMSVPLTAYARPDVAKITYTAHSVMKEFGFVGMQSFAVHGFIQPAGLSGIAESLGYLNDLTQVEKSLVAKALKEYPIGQWLDSADVPVSSEAVQTWTQAGGLIEFNHDEEIVKRFKSFHSEGHDKKSAFIVSVSQENLFLNTSRIEKSIQGMIEKAKESGDEVSFQVMTKGKKGRPIARNKGISRKS